MRHWLHFGMAALALACTGCLSHRDDTISFGVPKAPAAPLQQLAQRSDWGMPVTGLMASSLQDAQRKSPSGEFRLAWDAQALVVMADVTDTTPNESERANQLYAGDSVEVLVAPADRPEYRFQILVSPGYTAAFKEVRTDVVDHRGDKAPKLSYEVNRVARESGYRLIVRIPFSDLQMTPQAGSRLLVQVAVNDADEAGSRTQYVWYPSGESYRDAQAMYTLCLADKSDDHGDVAAAAGYRMNRGAAVLVHAPAAKGGAKVEVREGGRILGIGQFAAGDKQAAARVLLPLPREGKPYGPLTVVIDGRAMARLTLPERPDEESLVAEARFIAANCIFWSKTFPTCDFERPLDMEDLLGAYTVKTTYYDADLNPVTEATKPGRYAAASRITSESGKTYMRYNVLYRAPAKPDLRWTGRLHMQVELPAEFGADPAVVKRESDVLADGFTSSFRDALGQGDGWAGVLSTLAEMKPDQPRSVRRTQPGMVVGDYIARLRMKLEDYHYPYAVSLPKGYSRDNAAKYPLILFLHGSGERGHDLRQIETNPVVQFVRNHDLPFIVVSPQCPDGYGWANCLLDSLLKEVAGKYAVDPGRIYVTGLSMGGFGTWNLAVEFPQRFAAISPICGIGDADDVARIKDLPTWVFHGDADPTVPFEPDAQAVEALKRIHGRVRFTAYPGVGHDSWTTSYANPELYSWMLRQKLGEPSEAPVP